MFHLMICGAQLHISRPGYPNPCGYQLCQTLGGVYLTGAIEDSMKNGACVYQLRQLYLHIIILVIFLFYGAP